MARTHQLGEAALDERQAKKPRFDARNPSTLANDELDEDEELELDEIGKGGLKSKRNAIRLEGYDSDSSDDNFDTRAARRAGEEDDSKKKAKKKSRMEQDLDAFAEIDSAQAGHRAKGDGDDGGKKRSKKALRFMLPEEIEGQEQTSKSGGHLSNRLKIDEDEDVEEDMFGEIVENESDDETASDDSSQEGSDADARRDALDSDIDEELGAGHKKKHAPRLDAFNMQDELEEGNFDEAGNFIRHAKDPNAEHDSWLEGVSKGEMKRAREAQKRQRDERKRDAEEKAMQPETPLEDSLDALISRMRRDETIMETFRRIGGPKIKVSGRKGQKPSEMELQREEERKKTVNAMLAGVEQLERRGHQEVYEMERAMLQRLYQRETGKAWKPPPKEWEFRWESGLEVNGPYDTDTMKEWKEEGHFDQPGVEFREKGTEAWTDEAEFE